MKNKLLKIVKEPFNHLLIGLTLLAIANLLSLSSSWSTAGWIFLGITGVVSSGRKLLR